MSLFGKNFWGKYLYLTAICVLPVLWIVLSNTIFGPAFGGTDVYFFKDPAINWAGGTGFTSIMTYGNLTFEPELYATYPPIHHILYGLFFRTFGFSLESNQFLNSVIEAGVLAVILGAIVSCSTKHRLAPSWVLLCCFALAIALPNGVIGGGPDRPDRLSFIFLALATITLRKNFTEFTLIAAALFASLAFLTSPITGGISVLAIGAIWASRSDKRPPFFRCLLIGGFTFFILPVALVAILAQFHPEIIERFVIVLTGTGAETATGIGYFRELLAGNPSRWLEGLNLGSPMHILRFMQPVGAVVIGVVYVLTLRLPPVAGVLATILIVLLVGAPVLLAPYEANYWGISAGAVLMTALAIGQQSPANSPQLKPQHSAYAAIPLVLAVWLVFPGYPDAIRSAAVRINTKGEIGKSAPGLEILKSFSNHKDRPGNGIIGTNNELIVLMKMNRLNVIDANFPKLIEPESREDMDILALHYASSGDINTSRKTRWWGPGEYTSIYTPPNGEKTAIIPGLHYSKSRQSWEFEIFVRSSKLQSFRSILNDNQIARVE